MKNIMKRAGALLLALTMLLSFSVLCIPAVAAGESETVTLSSGDDLNAKIDSVKDGGTIIVNGTYTMPSGFSWTPHNKSVTITGGTFDVSSRSTLTLGDGVTFKNMTLTLPSGGTVYANGHRLAVESDVTVNNSATIYGGGASGSTVASTDVRLMAGTYVKVYGGSYKGTVSGDTNVYIGGAVNETIDATSHSRLSVIMGGGNGDTIEGDTHLTIADSAKVNYIYGGSEGSGATIGGTAYLTVAGGKMMSIYGGNYNVDSGCDVKTVMLGGEVEQVFGGNEAASFTGNVTLQLFGGTVTRRVYGGCYNDFGTSGFASKYGVSGTINLVLGSGVSITFSLTSKDDRSIYAKSRQREDVDGTCKLIYSDSAAETTYKNKLTAQDTNMKLIMAFVSAADSTHTLTHTLSGSKITETCNSCTDTATATLALDPSVSLTYNGSAICPAVVNYSSGWLGETAEPIEYENNVNAGNATATSVYARENLTMTLGFTIAKAPVAAPALYATNETVQGQSDGSIVGLTTAMEYSTDGGDYVDVTDTQMKLAPATYKVRIKETENYLASEVVTLTVQAGRHVIDTAALATKYQFPVGDTAQSESTTFRLISTVDSLSYSKVGFQVWIENSNGDMIEQDLLESNQVFTSILGADGEKVTTYTPSEEFCESSAYFFTTKLENIPSSYFGRKIRFRSYVVTTDGYTVYGDMTECTINELLSVEQ